MWFVGGNVMINAAEEAGDVWMSAGFDSTAYRAAFKAKDAEPWLAFYAEDAQWVEYRPTEAQS